MSFAPTINYPANALTREFFFLYLLRSFRIYSSADPYPSSFLWVLSAFWPCHIYDLLIPASALEFRC